MNVDILLAACRRFTMLRIFDNGSGWSGHHLSRSDIGHTRLEQQQKKNAETTFASPSRFALEKKKRTKYRQLPSFLSHAQKQ